LQRDINKLNGRLNDLEIKIYKTNDDKSILEKHNKELIEKINNFEAEIEERCKSKEDDIINLHNKITELEGNIEEKDQNINDLELRLNLNEELISKLKQESKEQNEKIKTLEKENEELKEKEKEEFKEKEYKKTEDESEKKETDEELKVNLNEYVLRSYHEEILEEKILEINTLINTVNVTKKEKEELDLKISSMKNSVLEITKRLEIEMENHSNNSEEKNEMIIR
jgi:chromosome segregation ATPase